MENIRFYWEFHKSTLIINWSFSVAFSMILFLPIMIPIISMTGGPLISVFYKDLSRKNEYYFYYNRGISKVKLIVVSLLLNIFIGAIIISFIQNVKSS